ncbi:MAG: hypothetical protein DYH20_05280 [Gammaproteobacteria bacterium PRO9]|nr:hypothetical protein [Gammaproteobacteria bacterium PRO9]
MPEVWFLTGLALLAAMTLVVQLLSTSGFIARDLMILLRYAFYICALLFGAGLGAAATRPNQVITRGALVGTIFVVVVTTAQYFDPGGTIGAFTLDIYGRSDYTYLLDVESRRMTGTLDNPNYWGYYIAALLLLANTYVLFGGRSKWVVAMLGLLWAIILSGSRTALLSPVIAWCGLMLLLTLVGQQKSIRAAVLTGAFMVIGGLSLYVVMTQGGYDYVGRFSIDNTKTLEWRMEHWVRLWNDIQQEPLSLILGTGPQKILGPHWADNMYLRLLRNFGIVAAGTYVALLWFVVRRLLKSLRGLTGAYRQHVIALLLLWLLIATFDLVADTWFNVRIASLVLFMHGFIIAAVARHARRQRAEQLAASAERQAAAALPPAHAE